MLYITLEILDKLFNQPNYNNINKNKPPKKVTSASLDIKFVKEYRIIPKYNLEFIINYWIILESILNTNLNFFPILRHVDVT